MRGLSQARSADDEITAVLRALTVSPWMLSGRDDAILKIARRHRDAVIGTCMELGWSMRYGDTYARLVKAPPQRVGLATAPDPAVASWFFLLVAAAGGMGRQVPIGELAKAAMACAQERGITVTEDRAERRSIGKAAELLHGRGVLEVNDGALAMFETDGVEARVLLTIHHDRLLQVIGNWTDEVKAEEDPEGWVAAVSSRSRLHDRPGDAGQHRAAILGALVDTPAVLADDVEEEGRLFLSQRIKRWVVPIADKFDLSIERRTEGVALVAAEESYGRTEELGPTVFPRGRMIDLIALGVCDVISTEGAPSSLGRGWLRLPEEQVVDRVKALPADRIPKDFEGRLERLVSEVRRTLIGADLIRATDDDWHLSPLFQRWESLPNSLTLDAPASRPAAKGGPVYPEMANATLDMDGMWTD